MYVGEGFPVEPSLLRLSVQVIGDASDRSARRCIPQLDQDVCRDRVGRILLAPENRRLQHIEQRMLEFRREVQRLSALNLLYFPFPGAAFASPKSSGRRRRGKENLAFPW